MKTKTTKQDIIYALKVRMNSVMIEKKWLYEEFLNGYITLTTYNLLVNDLLRDLKHYVEML